MKDIFDPPYGTFRSIYIERQFYWEWKQNIYIEIYYMSTSNYTHPMNYPI